MKRLELEIAQYESLKHTKVIQIYSHTLFEAVLSYIAFHQFSHFLVSKIFMRSNVSLLHQYSEHFL